MGNQQTTLSGIHPFKDENDQSGLPPPPLIQFPIIPNPLDDLSQEQQHHGPQHVTIGPASPRWIEATQGNKFDELFVMKAPTPPPRRPSEPLRGSSRSKTGTKEGFSLRNLPKMISRPDLNKLGTLLRWRKKRKSADVYPVPPDAEKPSPPSKPDVFLEQDEFFLLRWDPPAVDGGLPIIGYIIQHLELGLPQIDGDSPPRDDTRNWYSSEPGQVTSTEVLLNNLIEGTTYQFRIIAENLLGYSQPGELSSPIVFNPRGMLNDYFCPPIIIIPLDESYNAIEHERLVLSIEVTGQPYPIVKWYDRNDMEIGGAGGDPRYIVTSAGQKRMLTIAGVECMDSGTIRVVGENEKGVVECKTTLIVEAPPHIRRVQRLELLKSEDLKVIPTDDQMFLKRRDSRNDEEVIYQTGELAKFKFLWSASPYPNICVYHEGDLVDGEETGGDRGRVRSRRVVTEVTDNLITVKINGIQRTDRGEWLIRLDNVLGEDSATVLVTVTDRPSRTGKPDVLQLSDNTVILKWDKPQDDGGCHVQGYIIEYFRSEWGVWLKACTTKNPYTKIRDLIPGSKYKFRVKAENLYGVSDPSEESVELLITDLASTLRSVGGDGEGAGMLMTTVEEEEEEAVRIEEEEPGTSDEIRPTAPRRRFDRGSTASLMRVSTSTMTELSGLPQGKGTGSLETVPQRRPASPSFLGPQPTSSLHRSPSPSTKFLSVSFQPQVIVLPDDDEALFGEDILQPPELAPRRSPGPEISKRSPSPMNAPTIVQRSPSPSPPKPLTRTVVQQLNIEEPTIIMEEPRKSPSKSPVFEVLQPPIPPRRHVPHQPQLSPQPTPTQFPIQIQPIIDAPKKLYSRSEIIKSAATNELDYYYLLTDASGGETSHDAPHEEEPEEDPELLKVKEALKNDTLFDDLEDEEDEEYEYDFDKLREEYEEDKKRGMVSRQDSGVSGRSVEGRSESIEEPASYSEDLEEDESRGRAASVQSERVHHARPPIGGSGYREPFERAQSEVAGSTRRSDDDFMPKRRERPPPPPMNTGSRTMLTDRFTDYIAMKAASKNKAVGSSLRSLNRYSSTENVEGKGGSVSRDSGRSSMVVQESSGGVGASSVGDDRVRPEEREGEDKTNVVINRLSLIEPRPFTFREFKVEDEVKGLKGLEGSRSSWGSKRSVSSLPYDLVHPVQTGGSRAALEAGCDPNRELTEEEEKLMEEEERKRRSAPPVSVVPSRFISNPDIFLMMSADGRKGREVLEHSKSETNFDAWIPDSVLKMRAGSFIGRGGCGGEDTTEEDYSCGDEFGGSEEIPFERDCPADRRREKGRRSIPLEGDTEEDISYEEEFEKHEESGEFEHQEEEREIGEDSSHLDQIMEEGGNEEEGHYEERDIREDIIEECEEISGEEVEPKSEDDLVERDFGDMPQENVWVEEQVLEEYSEEDLEDRIGDISGEGLDSENVEEGEGGEVNEEEIFSMEEVDENVGEGESIEYEQLENDESVDKILDDSEDKVELELQRMEKLLKELREEIPEENVQPEVEVAEEALQFLPEDQSKVEELQEKVKADVVEEAVDETLQEVDQASTQDPLQEEKVQEELVPEENEPPEEEAVDGKEEAIPEPEVEEIKDEASILMEENLGQGESLVDVVEAETVCEAMPEVADNLKSPENVVLDSDVLVEPEKVEEPDSEKLAVEKISQDQLEGSHIEEIPEMNIKVPEESCEIESTLAKDDQELVQTLENEDTQTIPMPTEPLPSESCDAQPEAKDETSCDTTKLEPKPEATPLNQPEEVTNVEETYTEENINLTEPQPELELQPEFAQKDIKILNIMQEVIPTPLPIEKTNSDEFPQDKDNTIETSVQLEDTIMIEDVVIGKVDLEMDLQRISQLSPSVKHKSFNTNQAETPSPTRSPICPSPTEEEIDKELLSLQLELPAHQHVSSEPRRTISIDRLSILTPVQEELPDQPKQIPPSNPPSYRPHMSVYYDRVNRKPPSLSSSRVSISSQPSTAISSPRATSPFLDDDLSTSIDISEIRNTILQSTAIEFIESLSEAASSRPSTPTLVSGAEEFAVHDPADISPFMTYLFHGAFYLMLSPILFFVDSLYLALLCLVLVACVHFFIIKF